MLVDATGTSATSVTGAIRQAAQKTGASFDYLLATARVESNLNPSARASSSSAHGLFQFIEQTWLGTMKQAGPALGYGRYADAIEKTSSGRYVVQDPDLRREILNLRSDPAANALMAGAFTKRNGEQLAARIGRGPTEGELYLAHFLGAAGAGKLISLAAASPQANAAEVFPRAAGANRSIFYDKQGNPRSVAQVYGTMVGRYDVARARSPAVPEISVAARAEKTYSAAAPLSALQSIPPPASSTAPSIDPSTMLTALLSLPALAPPERAANAPPMFHELFHTVEQRGAVAPVVSELWGSQSMQAPAPQGSSPAKQAPGGHGGMRDLFRDGA
jgi:hypothetical protein